MIERVARAIADSYNDNSGRTQPFGWHLSQARTAIAAMREPTKEMKKASPACHHAWQAMIDCALSERDETKG